MGALSKRVERAKIRERRLAELRHERQQERLDADKRRLAADEAARREGDEGVSSAPRSPET